MHIAFYLKGCASIIHVDFSLAAAAVARTKDDVVLA